MSLTYDLTKIENYREVCFDDTGSLRPVTHALIYATISAGIGRVTENNADEFFARVAICERTSGAMLVKQDGDAFITPEDVKAHIGLRTNVSDETTAKWARRVIVGIPQRTVGAVGEYRRAYQSNIDKNSDSD